MLPQSLATSEKLVPLGQSVKCVRKDLSQTTAEARHPKAQ